MTDWVALLDCVGVRPERHRNALHRPAGRVEGADQRTLAGAAVVPEADLHQDLLPLFTRGQRVRHQVCADIRLEGGPIGGVPLPPVGERAGQAVRIGDAGGRGGQGLAHLRRAADGRYARRRVVHGGHVDRDEVFGGAVLRPVVHLELEACVGCPVALAGGAYFSAPPVNWAAVTVFGRSRGDRRAVQRQRACR